MNTGEYYPVYSVILHEFQSAKYSSILQYSCNNPSILKQYNLVLFQKKLLSRIKSQILAIFALTKHQILFLADVVLLSIGQLYCYTITLLIEYVEHKILYRF